MSDMIKKIRDWQVLIAGISVAVSLFYAGTAAFHTAFTIGTAVQQHNTIIDNEQVILEMLREKCK